MQEIRRSVGEYDISLRADWVGADLHVFCTGGQRTHIGAVTLALPYQNGPGYSASLSTLSAPGHQDEAVGRTLAKLLCKRLGKNIVVCAGIHYDQADRALLEQIVETVEAMGRELLRQC